MSDRLTYDISQLGLDTETTGFCMIPGRTMGCYVPNLMTDVPMGDNPRTWKESLSSRMIKNSKLPFKLDTKIEFENYILIEPNSVSNIDPPNYNKGENFLVTFLDNDIKKGLYSIELNDDSLRRDDKYRIYTKDGDDEYHVSVDSQNGVIEIKSTAGNHGSTEHRIQLDQKNDSIKINDSKGNGITLDSRSGNIKLLTTSGAGIIIGNGTVQILGRIECEGKCTC